MEISFHTPGKHLIKFEFQNLNVFVHSKAFPEMDRFNYVFVSNVYGEKVVIMETFVQDGLLTVDVKTSKIILNSLR